MFRTKKWGCPLCHLGGQLLPADPEPWAACLHVHGVLLPPGDIHILVHLPLFYAVFCWFSVLVMWFFYCFVPGCTRCSVTIGSIRQRWAAQHASGASECYAEEWPSTPRVWHFLHLYFFFFFFLKRNVSHLGFIFVFSEDYFLFSPFSFFWEDRLFTVDYRQKCCSPSYETAFFFPQEEVLLHLFSQIPLLVQADSASAQQPEVADACKWGGTCAADICWGPQMLTQVGEQSYNTKRLKFSKFCSTTEEIFWSHSAFQTAQIFAEAVLVCRGYRENNYLSPRNVSSN